MPQEGGPGGGPETLVGEIGPPVLSPSVEGSAANRRSGRGSRPPLAHVIKGMGSHVFVRDGKDLLGGVEGDHPRDTSEGIQGMNRRKRDVRNDHVHVQTPITDPMIPTNGSR